jgi:hypothetical protein
VAGRFYSEDDVQEGVGFRGAASIDGQGRRRVWARLCPDEKDDLDRWGPPVGGREREGRYPFGLDPGWAMGRFGGWAERVPEAFFLFPLFLFFFFF